MRIQFSLRFFTHPGQSIHVLGNLPALGNDQPDAALALNYLNDQFWQGSIETDQALLHKIRYRYLLKEADGSVVAEWGKDRLLDGGLFGQETLHVIDTWNFTGAFENLFYTDPFQHILLQNHASRHHAKLKKEGRFTHVFRVKAPLLEKHEVVCLLGNHPALSDWNTESPILLRKDKNWWQVQLHIDVSPFTLQYKFGVYNTRTKSFVRFEEGENRTIPFPWHDQAITLLHDGFIHLPNNSWKGAGVSIPVFSLRSRQSFGIGEFNDLRLLADWARKTGIKLIQILPVNDTTATYTWTDSYPYAAISAFALHPIYLNLQDLAGKKFESLIKPLRKKQKQLNELAEVDYEQVLKIKLTVCKELYLLQKDEWLKDEDFKSFFEQHKHWLIPYAAFSYLRDKNGHADFSRWKTYSSYKKESILKLVSPRSKYYEEIAFYYYLQYHLHLQLKSAVDYVHKQGVILKGDIPIGVYRYGADAWENTGLYHLDQQAGAPPDDFTDRGQNWGFPTYNWEKMADNGFAWWHSRFLQMSNYFDAFRIDHILGFFRIWSVPLDSVEGIMGRFVPALPVTRFELVSWGTGFDYDRYCQPYITDAVLWEMFGPNKESFLPFLQLLPSGTYALKDTFRSQQQVATWFAGVEDTEDNRMIRQGLFDLIANVLLFEEEGSAGEKFHFRIGIEKTSSFKHLPDQCKEPLHALYIDYFFRRQDEFWKKEALKKLPALKESTNMLICGEDLGMVPHCVPAVMKDLGILSLEIQRMPKRLGQEFFRPSEAPYLSVVTASTHDMSTIRSWWEEDRNRTQHFYEQELGQTGEAPYFCEAWINKAIVLQHLYSPAMWSIFQLQDLLGMSAELRRENPHEERINVPANPKHYWRYRMHLLLEDMIKEKAFNSSLKSYVESAGR